MKLDNLMANTSYTHNCIEIVQIIKYCDVTILLDYTNDYYMGSMIHSYIICIDNIVYDTSHYGQPNLLIVHLFVKRKKLGVC